MLLFMILADTIHHIASAEQSCQNYRSPKVVLLLVQKLCLPPQHHIKLQVQSNVNQSRTAIFGIQPNVNPTRRNIDNTLNPPMQQHA